MPPSSATAYQALSGYKAPDASSVLTQADNQAGVGAAQSRVSDLQGSVKNLQSSLDAVDPSVTGRTTGTFTTDAQRGALVNKEAAPIQQSLTAANGNLGTATGQLQTSQGNANTMATAILGQNKDQYQQLLDQYNAASASEKQAESVRQFNETLAQQKLQAAQSAAAAKATNDTALASLNAQNAQNTQVTQDTNSKAAAGQAAATANAKVLTGNKSPQDAYNAIKSLLLTNNQGLIESTIAAINKSASYGNTYDKAKLEAIQKFGPQFYSEPISASVNQNGATF
jgi:hypothetical protein